MKNKFIKIRLNNVIRSIEEKNLYRFTKNKWVKIEEIKKPKKEKIEVKEIIKEEDLEV